MALTLSGTDGVVGAGFTLDSSGASVTAGVGTFSGLKIGTTASLTMNVSNTLQITANSQVGVSTFIFGDTQVGSAYTDVCHFEISPKNENGTAISHDDDSNVAYIRRRDNGGDLGVILRHQGQNRERIRMMSDGKIGIGTTTPSTTVDAIGTVRATSFTATQPEYLRVAHTDNSHNQSRTDNSTVTIQFGSTYNDTKSGWTSGSSNYYEIQETGYFLITTQAVITSNDVSSLRDWALGVEQSTDNGSSYSLLMNNGGRGGGNDYTDTDTVTPSVTIVQYLSAGTRIRVRAYANTDGGTWQIDEDLGDTSGGNDYGGSGFDNQKGTRLFIMRLF